MDNEEHRVDLIVDEKSIATEGKHVELRIDGLSVYKLERFASFFKTKERSLEDFETFNLLFLLRIMRAMFGHPDRYKIVNSLTKSPKTFTEIQKSLSFKAATLDFHLKKLVDEMVIGKNDKKYVLTIVGEVILDYFSDLLQKVKTLYAYPIEQDV